LARRQNDPQAERGASGNQVGVFGIKEREYEDDRQPGVRYVSAGAPMTAVKALEKQIECYRRMTGEQRLAIALDLHELSCEVAREGIRRQHPKADDTEVERLLHARLKLARCA
jgi:hypothetical protein